jgi:subtilisin family serine protease
MEVRMHRSKLVQFALLVAVLAACQEAAGPPDVLAPSLALKSPNGGASEVIPDRYVVVLVDDGSDPEPLARAVTAPAGGQLHFVYRHALRGFAATLPQRAVAALRNNPNVARVEPDLVVRAVGSGVEAAPSWGLDRIDQRSTSLDGSYTWNASGQGVTVYIIDTGIRISHEEFGGRARVGFDAIGDGQNGNDCNGHGTHVAGTIGGSSYGVAKDADIVAVRVLGCDGSGSTSGVIAGVDWVTQSHSGPSVANMSLAAFDWLGFAFGLDLAVQNSTASGVSHAVAAANDAFDACYYTPARVADAMTVGASDANDARASFSNYGDCVDWFAPGVNITSAWNSSDEATLVASGTSMASPHTAGVAAIYLELAPGATPAQVTSTLYDATTKNVIAAALTQDNHLLYSLLDGSAPPPPPHGNESPIASFTSSCTGLGCTFTDQSRDPDGTLDSWSWDFGDGNSSTERDPTHAYAAAGTYQVTLVVTDDGGASSSPSSESVTVQDPNALTLSARKLRARGQKRVRLDWNPAMTVDVWRATVGDLFSDIIAPSVSGDTYTDDTLGKKTRGTFLYFVCQTGNDNNCSNLVEVSF